MKTSPFQTRSFRFQWPADLCTAWALEMESLILGWYVLVETGSIVLLTVYGSLLLIGTLLSPLLGMLGDRFGLRRVLAAMRASYAVFAAMILLAAATGYLNPTLVLAVAALSGLVRPTDIGMRSALVGATVPQAQLVAAMGISRTTQDSARIGGALLGTGFMAAFGMVPAYGVITAFYLAGTLLTLRVDARPSASSTDASPLSAWRDLKDGLVYVWRTPRLRAAIGLAALVNFTAFPLTGGLMPYVAREVFQVDQQGLGWLVASFGTGALLGSVGLSVFGQRLRPARSMLAAAVAWHLCLLGFVASSSLPVAMGLLVAAGFAQSVSMVSLAILLLSTCEPRFRGRIMGARMLAIYTLPFGLLAAGAMIPAIGFGVTATAMLVLGLLLVGAIAIVWRGELLARLSIGNRR